jgi:hypothetical protein
MLLEEKHLKVWLNSGDPFLLDLAQKCLGEDILGGQELTEILTFLAVASLGVSEVELFELREVYTRRINLFIEALPDLGYNPGYHKEYLLKKIIPSPYYRILRSAFGKSSYKMLELKRY